MYPYCHVIYHWNLPSNPVNLELREVRIHRYKGHDVRRNIAKAIALKGLVGRDWNDPRAELFTKAAERREPGMSELVPY